MIAQPELFKSKRRAPFVSEADIELLIEILGHSETQWVKANEISTATCWNDRKIRAIANAAKGKIISSDRGYKLLRHATTKEINECLGRLEHQANQMIARAVEIKRLYHARGAV